METEELYRSRGEEAKALHGMTLMLRLHALQVTPRPDPVVWTSKGTPLSKAQLRAYDEQGFCILRNLIPPEELEACRRYLESFASASGEQLVTEQCRLVTEANSTALRSIFAVHEDESPLGDLAGSKLLTECVQQILDDDIYVHQTLGDGPL